MLSSVEVARVYCANRAKFGNFRNQAARCAT